MFGYLFKETQMDAMRIESMIYILRGERVMLDSDLAELYGVSTKSLNQQVRRNLDRFPEDFMFLCNSEELSVLRSQIVTANSLTDWNHKRRSSPMLFTENGVAMLSSVLNSKTAIHVNISIIRIFTKLRSFLLMEESLNQRMNKLESGTNKIFKIVFERLDAVEESTPALKPNRKKISLSTNAD
jgi:hypothetical protein